METMEAEKLTDTQPPSCRRLINYTDADVRYGFNPDIPLLFVAGDAPCFNMEVTLEPYIYVNCPEYWGIELIGTLPGDICLRALKPFQLVLPLTGITGSKGVQLIGAERSETFEVSGGCENGPL